MVVKEKRGRRRYLLFSVSPDITKEVLIKRFRNVCSSPPFIVQSVPGMILLRCSPENRDDVISLMSVVDPSSISLRTSGTIKTIREEFPELKTVRSRPS